MGERASHTGLSSEAVPSAADLAEEAAEAPAPEPAAAVADAPEQADTLLPRARAARVIAWLTALAGLLYLLPELPVLHGRMGLVQDYFADQSIRIIGHVVSVVTGFVLILVAIELGRRKRLAWQVALLAFSLGVVTHVFKGPHPIVVLFSLGMIAALAVVARRLPRPLRSGVPARPRPLRADLLRRRARASASRRCSSSRRTSVAR